ncbi:MAG: hypothetical protein K2X48_10275 [Chitinophagaceae bacterium]|nr:hypothetical protein [Chitinophagaceae bacterium]
MRKLIAAIVVCMMLMHACRHDTLIPGGTPPPGITPPPAGASVICFETNVLPIFVSNCAKPGCHNSVTRAKNLRFDNYTEIMKSIRANEPNNSNAWKVMNETRADKIMPPPPAAPLTKAQKDSVYKWIVQGALNTTNCNVVRHPIEHPTHILTHMTLPVQLHSNSNTFVRPTNPDTKPR